MNEGGREGGKEERKREGGVENTLEIRIRRWRVEGSR